MFQICIMMIQQYYIAIIQIFIVHVSFLTTTSAGIKCPGYCTKDLVKCRAKGGKIIGYCTNSLACCDPVVAATGSCGDTKFAQKTVFFKSSDFPDFSQGDLNCEFNVKLFEDTVGIRVEFIKAEMDGMSYLRSEADGGNCESDMIFFRGFGTWAPPPLCGNLTGYVSILDKFSEASKNLKTLTVVALMSSLSYRWHIKISQISKNQLSKNKTVAVNETSPSDYEDISIMVEEKSTYRYKRSEDTDESVSEKPIASSTVNIKDYNSTDADSETTTKNADYDYSDTTVSIKVTSTSTENVLPQMTTASGFRRNGTLNQLQQNGEYEKPEHRFEIPLIVNGQDTEVLEVPWQASIRIKANYTKSKAKSNDANQTSEILVQPDVLSNEIDSNKTQLELDESILLNGTAFDTLVNRSTITEESNCSESEGFHFCGGALISNNLILSAAHCFFGNSKNDAMTDIESLEVVLGDTNLCTDESKQEILPSYSYDVENIFIHYAYDPHLLINDIAILKLKKNVTFADNVRIVTLAKLGANFSDKEALVSGWGDTNLTESSSPTILQSSMDFQIQNQSYCNERDLEQYTDTKEAILRHPKYRYVFEATLCTLGTKDNKVFEISSGKGDSGGGLIVFDDFGEPILAGIVSYGVAATSGKENRKDSNKETEGDDAESKTMDYFTSVSFYRKWIDLAML